MAEKELEIYLQDHYGGSTAGLELAKRAAGHNEDGPYGAELASLATEIEEDRDALRRLMEQLDVGPDRIKVTGGWIGEKFGRLKLNGSLLEYSPLSRLVEVEGLFLGVTGKLALWENMIATHGERIESTDVAALAERARSQRSRLDDMRKRAAAEALSAA